ncbi:hypodermin-A [Bombyx mori]|uniref:Peptidase S1 domain-containing protein n=1 Tax=Bombyx mori TaxID=7091 RepID=A0A8R1WI45_BOMMO|nr:hypodermin-A [Bombyx mori]
MNIYICVLLFIKTVSSKIETVQRLSNAELDEHTRVTNSHVFPYVVAILQRSKYVSAGALIDENWILTAADGLFLMRETLKLVKVRLGSINYKKGGLLLPAKLIQIHPYFDDKSPIFDVAMVQLAETLRFTPKIKAIRLQKTFMDVAATHFIVTSWNPSLKQKPKHPESMEAIERRRMLTVTHLHPSEVEECAAELDAYGVNKTDLIMCLDPPGGSEICVENRNVGAPVVLNGVLWGVVSSWKTSDCDQGAVGPSFVTRVSAPDVTSWIHATLHGHRWKHKSNE